MPTATFASFDDGLQAADRKRDHYIYNPDLKDDRLWVPYGDGVWLQLCHVNVSAGSFTLAVKLLPGTKVPKHYHVGTVQGYTLQGTWHYLEHDWVATKGTFIYERPGESHTLVVPADAPEPMITIFVASGGLVFVDDAGAFLAYEDGFTLLKLVRDYYQQADIDPSRVNEIIR